MRCKILGDKAAFFIKIYDRNRLLLYIYKET